MLTGTAGRLAGLKTAGISSVLCKITRIKLEMLLCCGSVNHITGIEYKYLRLRSESCGKALPCMHLPFHQHENGDYTVVAGIHKN